MKGENIAGGSDGAGIDGFGGGSVKVEDSLHSLTEEQLARRMAELDILNRMGRQVCAELDLRQVARAAIAELNRVLSPDVVLVYRLEKDELELIEYSAQDHFFYEAKHRHRVGECLCGLAAKDRQAVFSLDIHSDRRCTGNECRDAGMQSFAALPMISGDKLLGVVGMAFLKRRDLREHIPFLDALVAQIAIGIRNAELHEEIKRHAGELELQVAARTGELARALGKALESDRMKTVFLASMSHEFRTPLNSIIGFAGIMQKEISGPLNPDQKKQIGMIQNSSRQLLRLVGDILDVARIEAGRMETVVEPFLMNELVREVIAFLREATERKGLFLNWSVTDEVEIIWSDRARVSQILSNLLENAVKFTQTGGVEVHCELDGEWLLTEVSDTGIGIEEQDRERIFEDFVQVDGGLARSYSGAGIGLALCRRLVALLDGSIGVRSEGLGQGSTFYFRLPMGKYEQGSGERGD